MDEEEKSFSSYLEDEMVAEQKKILEGKKVSPLYKPNTDTPAEVQAVIEESIHWKRKPKYNYDLKVINNLLMDGKSDAEISRLLQIPYQSIHGFIVKNCLREKMH